MKIGYARVSTGDQNLAMQMDALREAGCEKIYEEKISGKSKDRPRLNELITILRKGDVVYVWKLDRLGRSLKDLISLIGKFNDLGVDFVSINDNIDTSTPMGKLVFHMVGAFSEFERDIMVERTR